MPYKNESMLMGGDATADLETQLCFDPPGGPFPPGNDNVVRGTIAHSGDEDWVKIELTAGVLYTFTLTDDDGNDATYLDTILALYDGKGGFIKRNDDIDGAMGNLHSSFQYVPEQSGAHFLSASVFAANLGANTSGAYRLTVTESAAGLPDPIEGTEGDDKLRGTDAGERLSGLGGNDSLFGLAGDDVLNGGAGNDLLVGGAGGDRLNGGAGNDTISYNTSTDGVTVSLRDATARGGHASGDIIAADIENVTGSSSPDALTGNDEMNILNGLGGDDVLRGDFGDDTLNGGPGDDELDGGHDNDTLAGGPGADRLTGGEGNDTASFAGSMEGVEVRLHANRLAGGDAEGDVFVDTTTVMYQERPDPEEPAVSRSETVPDIVHLTGSGLADVLAGDSRNNTIMGGGGDDMIYGGPKGNYDDTSNNDTLMGQGGNDKIYGGKGVDTLDGGPGNDLLVGGSGADAFVGGPGSDMIYADRADIASTIHGHNMPTDTDGDDPTGAMGKMAGEMDTLSFAKFTDQDLEDGTGIILNLEESTAVTNINRLIGTSGEDMLTGRTGTDDAPAPEIIEGGADQDTLVGGDGPGDTVSYESSDRGVDVELKGGTADGSATDSEASGGHARRDTISGFENVMGSAYDDSLTAVTGTAGEVGSTLWGLDGDDELTGLAGNDTLEGGAGADELDGGFTEAATGQNTEINTLSYAMSDAGVRVDLTASSAAGGHAEGDEIETYRLTIDDRDFEVATFINVTGSDHNDTLTGDLFGNQLVGGTGDDTLLGGVHGDTLIGGPGADTLNGGSSTWNHDSATDTDGTLTPEVQHEDWAAYRDAMAGVAVNLHSGRGTAGEAMGDVLTGIELIWGSRHDDTFIASARADRIHGDGGVDTVSYEASLSGVTVVLPTTDDTAQFDADGPDDNAETLEDNGAQAALDSVVTTWRAGTAQRPGPVQADDGLTSTRSYAEGDELESIENVTGSRRNDVITGDGVPNVLMGGAGNDELVGGAGNDTLHGGEGNDLLGQKMAKAEVDLNEDGDTDDPGDAVAVDAITDDEGDDMMFGGPGNDRLYGGAGADTLNGGPGDDDLQGDAQDDPANPTNTDPDTFVFTKDGLGSDLILDFSNDAGVAIVDGTADTNGAGDKIDLRAFDIEAGDLPGLLGSRGGSVILNLESYGGGRVFIQGGVTLLGLMGDDADDNGVIDGTDTSHLIHDDQNGMLPGVGEEGTDGVFIL